MTNATSSNQKPVDITAFDAVTESDNGCEIELLDTDGMTGTGVHLTILGKNADAVVKWVTRLVNNNIREQQIAARKGKTVEAKGLDELRDQNIEGAAVRVTGWRNVTQPFTPELLKAVLLRNPHWINQIIEESDNLGNFTKPQ